MAVREICQGSVAESEEQQTYLMSVALWEERGKGRQKKKKK